MKEEEKRDIVLKIAWHYLGTPYVWGGDDPSSFDCSGFVIECLKSVGILPRQGDWTAQQLWNLFQKTSYPMPGDLVFYHSLGKIIHVEIAINRKLSIGASGGGSKTKTVYDAFKQNAYVKVRPIGTRKNLRGYADPYWGVE